MLGSQGIVVKYPAAVFFFLLRIDSTNSGNYFPLAGIEKNLNSSFPLGQLSISQILLALVLVCSFNDLLTDELLAHRASENEKVLAQKKNLLVTHDRTALILSPALAH